jgi:diacylglycerol kinase family enzyme
MREAAEQLLRGRSQRLDVGVISCQDLKGRPLQRLFANIAEGGLGAATVQRVDSRPKRGGTIPFLTGAIRTLAGFRNRPVKVTVDDQTNRTLQAVIVIIANGRFFGGGMKIAPQAKPDDGLFDIVLVKDLSRLKILRNLYRIYTGSHLELPEVEVLRGTKVSLESDEDLLLEADGELLGRAPAEFTIRPQAIQVRY